jgi:Co/Zn/Cd efflux system component
MKSEQEQCILIDQNINTTRNRLDEEVKEDKIERMRSGDSVFNLTTLISSAIRLAKMNEEFYYLTIYIIMWLTLCMSELLYGFLENKVEILSDAFFIYFKTFTFLITGFSLLLSKVYVFNNIFLKNRIELLSAMANLVFLVITSLHMCIQALHLITEKHEHEVEEDTQTVSFLNNFFMIKIVLNLLVLLKFADYLIHPSIQIKMLIWKKYRRWSSTFDSHSFGEASKIIKQWNNHFENMNALTVNVLCDMVTSILFIILLYISSNNHYEYVFSIVCLVNISMVAIMAFPSLSSILLILMQGKSDIYEPFKTRLDKEITLFEGCNGIESIKLWQISQNEIKCNILINIGYIKIFCNVEFDRKGLNELLRNMTTEMGIDCDFTIEVNN